MKVKYCLPIIKNTKTEVTKSLQVKGYDYYEIWLDYIKDLDKEYIVKIAKKYKRKIVFVLRRQNLKTVEKSFEERRDLISFLSNFDFFLDLDFLTQHEELEFFKKEERKIKLILSYHNYKETPKLDYIENLLTKMERYNPHIFKVSTYCQKEEDALSLLNLLLKLKTQKLRCIVLGMGKKGLITRIFGSIWGNEVSFTPKDIKEKTAEGQLTKKQMDLILKEIN